MINNNGPYPDEAQIQIAQNLGYTTREKLLAGGLIVIFFLLMILGFSWLISRIRQKRRAKIDELTNRLRETELKAIKAQMNPHFLFNSLNSIQNLINQQNIEAANLYLSRFARLLHAVLQYSENEFVPLADEIETLSLYVQLEKLRFNFEFNLMVDPEIDIYNTFVPPLLFQPFIENAILHGLQQKEGDKNLTINIEERKSQLICMIADNGVGRTAAGSHRQNHHGMGNKLSLERIKLLNQKNSSSFKFDISDIELNGTGTLVTISFNNNLI
ncbi:histidine kinase [uncultured Sunxiuqinia sp.]|uniref:sensor histidine kinase n=1 Tax=uncultured Sunxiuqinia sp. TaxID=1573825 RepID=UPI002AA72B73|nr:histidine kinase [uncultured Sunxiuqinia sp.]